MLLVIHIAVALLSLVMTSVLLISPVRRRFYVAYSLVGLTLLSGTVLVVSSHSPLLQACVSGLAYLGLVSGGLIVAHYRLVKQESRDRID